MAIKKPVYVIMDKLLARRKMTRERAYKIAKRYVSIFVRESWKIDKGVNYNGRT